MPRMGLRWSMITGNLYKTSHAIYNRISHRFEKSEPVRQRRAVIWHGCRRISVSLSLTQGTITQDIITKPVLAPTNSNDQIHVTKTPMFSVTTQSPPTELGGPVFFLD